jgi:hypothetical protein
MVIIEIVSIIIRCPLQPVYPVVKDELQFRPLDFAQKFLNASEKIPWSGELLFYQCRLHVPEKPEVRRCQVRTVRWMGYSKIEFPGNGSQSLLSGGRDSCQGAKLADENAVCDRLEILRAALIPKCE